MRRGDIVLAELDLIVGREQGKVRPVVLVSNNANIRTAEENDGTLTIVPITSNVRAVYSYQVRLDAVESGLGRESKIQCEQPRTISVRRLSQRLGRLSSETLAAVEEGLRLHLGL